MEADASSLLLGGRPVVKLYSQNIAGVPVMRISFLWVTIRVFAGAVHLCYGFIAWAVNQLFAATSETGYLNRHADDLDITRLPAVAGTGAVVFSGTQDGTVIPQGTCLVALNGTQYITTAQGTISSGIAQVAIRAVIAGAVGNQALAVTLSLVSPIENVDSYAGLVAAITDGADEESDTHLLARIKAQQMAVPPSGKISDYVEWAESVSGVLKAFAFSGYGGSPCDVRVYVPSYIGVTCIVSAAPHIPSQGTIDAIQALIDPRPPALPGGLKPAGNKAVCYAPTAKSVTITIDGLPAALQGAVEAALDELILADCAPGGGNYNGADLTLKMVDGTVVGVPRPGAVPYPGALYVAHIVEAISSVVGGALFTLATPSADVTFSILEFPELSFVYTNPQ
jgi:uncharacterized phage protein gp47/JayE